MTIDTDRLLIEPLSEKEARFIFELLNTERWIKYIGNRNIDSESDAINYIKKINENPDITYWTVKLKVDKVATGLVTLIKRDYLDFNDIGFAFLPNFFGKGYAYEATKEVLLNLARNNTIDDILAITFPENSASIKLIEKLGLKFEKTIKPANDILSIYHASKNTFINDKRKIVTIKD